MHVDAKQVSSSKTAIAGVILAGGKGRRLNGVNKALIEVNGRALIDIIVVKADRQVDALVINANAYLNRFMHFGLSVVEDGPYRGYGPLAGVFAAMHWLRADRPDITHLATFPCDGPLLPDDFVSRLYGQMKREQTSLAVAVSHARIHPTFGLFSLTLHDRIKAVLDTGDIPSLQTWALEAKASLVNWGNVLPDPFFNMNTQKDMDAFLRMPEKRSKDT